MTTKPPSTVGIDLATTYSAIAHVDARGRPVTIPNSNGNLTTPSVVLIDTDGVVVGEEAVMAMAAEAHCVADCAKRDMGQPFYHREIGGRKYPPEVIQAYVLKKLREDASERIGPVAHAVITVPAYFDEIRRKATQDAGYMAGIEVLDIINEPTAAALAFGVQEGFLSEDGCSAQRQRILVYDLGGGTFDLTLMDIEGSDFTTIATDGDFRLGGQDWDFRLVDLVAEEFVRHFGTDPRSELNSLSRLWRNCEESKRALSARQETSITCEYQGNAHRVRLTREGFENATRDLLERTRMTTEITLKDAGVAPGSIDRVLLVGGSTKMPMVKRMIREALGKEPDIAVSGDEAVAQGAAIHAAREMAISHGSPPTFRLHNVNAHSLGVVGIDKAVMQERVVALIPRNTRLPANARRLFKTKKADQRSVLVKVTEGESPTPDGCSMVGTCSVRNLPARLPADSPISVTFHYRSNGRLSVGVKVAGSSEQFEHELVRDTGMSRDELDAWRDYICGDLHGSG